MQGVSPRSLAGFNSRTREGCDVTSSATTPERGQVSIHAPGRGATRAPFFAPR